MDIAIKKEKVLSILVYIMAKQGQVKVLLESLNKALNEGSKEYGNGN